MTLCSSTVSTFLQRFAQVSTHSASIGGLGDAVADVLIGHGDFAFEKVGIQDRFGQSGTPDELLEEYGLSTRCIIERMRAMARR